MTILQKLKLMEQMKKDNDSRWNGKKGAAK